MCKTIYYILFLVLFVGRFGIIYLKIARVDSAKKDVRSSYGDVPMDIPRNRKSEFEPRAIRKYETECSELDKK